MSDMVMYFRSRVSDKNLKLAAIRVNTNIFVILNSIEMGKKKKKLKGVNPTGKPHSVRLAKISEIHI